MIGNSFTNLDTKTVRFVVLKDIPRSLTFLIKGKYMAFPLKSSYVEHVLETVFSMQDILIFIVE